MKKILTFIISFFSIFLIVSAKENSYDFEKMYVYANIEIAGGIKVTEYIETNKKTFDRSVYYAVDGRMKYDKSDDSLFESDIHNGSAVSTFTVKVGNKKLDKFESYQEEFADEGFTTLTNEEYTLKDIDNGANIKFDNKDNKVIILSYVISNVLVEHEDCAEFNYTFIDERNTNTIKEYVSQVLLPFQSETLKSWAHGKSDSSFIQDTNKYGVKLLSNDVGKVKTSIRMLFDKDIFMININKDKKSEKKAINIIEKAEKNINKNEKNIKLINTIIKYVVLFAFILYMIFTIIIINKYDSILKKKKGLAIFMILITIILCLINVYFWFIL